MGLLNVLRTIALAIGLVVGFSGIRNIAAATKRVAPTCAEILAERALEAISSTRLTPNEAWSKLKKDLELASGPTVLLTSFSISANVSMAMLMELGKLAASLGVEVDFELSTANAVRTKTSSIIYQNFVFSGPAAKIAKLMTSIASKPFVETLTLRHSEVLNALVDEPLILPALKTLDSTSEKNQNELYKVAFEKAAQAPVLLIDQPGRFSVLVASEIFDRWAKNSKVASAFKVHRTTLSDMAKSLNGLGAIDRHSKRGVYQVSDPTSKNQIYVISMDVFSILQREAADGVLGESEPAVLREKIRSLLKVETQQIAPILEDLPIEAPAKPSIAELKSAKTKAERRTETISGKQSLSISAFIFLNNKQNLLISPAGVVIEKQGSGPNGVQRNRATIPRAVYFAARPELDAQYVVEQIQKHLERYDASLVLSHDQVEQLREPIARLLSDPAPSDIQLIPNDPNGRLRRLNELTLGTERPPVLLKRASSGIYGLLIPIAPVPEVAKSTATAESIEPGPVTQAPMTSDRTHLGSPTQDLVGQMELIRPGMEISEIGPKTILGRFKPFREFLNRPETYLDGLMGDPKTSTAGAPFLVLTRRSVNSTAESPYLVLFSESYFGAATEELLFAQYRYALQLGEGESLTGGLQRRFLDELLGERTRNAEVMTAKALR
ncbi:MAG TPA: hypothetical protein PLH57_06005, partial [Oligoflexia bacterium]|nr:hypothetical protein [Oligoflexia bacterium]